MVNSFVSDLTTPLIGLFLEKSLSYAYLALKCPEGLEDMIRNSSDKISTNITLSSKTLKVCQDKALVQRTFITPELANTAGI